jgi:hypothetical protein
MEIWDRSSVLWLPTCGSDRTPPTIVEINSKSSYSSTVSYVFLAVCLISGHRKLYLLPVPTNSPPNLHTNNNKTQQSSTHKNEKHLSIHNSSINHWCTTTSTTITTTTTTTNNNNNNNNNNNTKLSTNNNRTNR